LGGDWNRKKKGQGRYGKKTHGEMEKQGEKKWLIACEQVSGQCLSESPAPDRCS